MALAGEDFALEDVLGLRGHPHVDGVALDEFDGASGPRAGGLVLGESVGVLGDGGSGCEDEEGVHADGDGAGGVLALGLVFEDVDGSVAVADASVGRALGGSGADCEVALDFHGGVVAVDDHGAVLAHVVCAGLGVDGDDACGGCDVASGVEFVPEGGGDFGEVDVFAEDFDLLDGAVVDLDAGEPVGHALLDDVVEFHPVTGAVEGDGELLEGVHDVGDELLVGVVDDVLEEEAGAVAGEVAVADGADFVVEVDGGR